jgi:hypothetical protein
MRLVYVRAMRRNSWMIAAVLGIVAGGCSSGSEITDPDPDPDPIVVGTVDPPVPTTIAPTQTTELVELESAPPLQVDMTVVANESGVNAEISAAVDPAELEQIDPFGTFASCSGARRSFGPYSVLASVPDGSITGASISTTAAVTDPGTHDAAVGIELRSGATVRASGTVTIDASLRSGSFVAFEPGGGRVTGSFTCSGGDPAPAPLPAGNLAGVLDTVEVVVLLRQGEAERVLDLAVDTSRSPDVAVECPASVGGSGPVLVRVDGDQSVGAITTFELTDGGAPTMRLRVGGAGYAFDEVTITIADPPNAGTFSATDGDVTVDGAFRCT